MVANRSGIDRKARCVETRTSRVNGAPSQLLGKCNINYSPADLPPRLLRRYAQVVPVSNGATADALAQQLDDPEILGILKQAPKAD